MIDVCLKYVYVQICVGPEVDFVNIAFYIVHLLPICFSSSVIFEVMLSCSCFLCIFFKLLCMSESSRLHCVVEIMQVLVEAGFQYFSFVLVNNCESCHLFELFGGLFT